MTLSLIFLPVSLLSAEARLQGVYQVSPHARLAGMHIIFLASAMSADEHPSVRGHAACGLCISRWHYIAAARESGLCTRLKNHSISYLRELL